MRTLLTLLFCLLPLIASAQWPTTVEEHLEIAVGPETNLSNPITLQLSADRTLVVLRHGPSTGPVYQIIDRYGRLEFPESQLLWPAVSQVDDGYLRVISDGDGGAIVGWENMAPPQDPGISVQRINSLGEIQWGDSARFVFSWENSYWGIIGWDICARSGGGFFAVMSQDDSGLPDNLYLQRLDNNGNRMWSETGIVACPSNNQTTEPIVISDESGGCYIIWKDFRSTTYGKLFMQRYDSDGNRMWEPDSGRFICYHTWFHQVIPDGENGFILQSNPGPTDYNTIYRIGPDGDILWEREEVSWYYWATISTGEPGFFYLCFPYYPGFPYILDEVGIYAQKMDIQGNTHWPTNPGAEMAYVEQWAFSQSSMDLHCRYQDGRLFGIYEFHRLGNESIPRMLYVQALNESGEKLFGNLGSLVAMLNEQGYERFRWASVAPDDDGGVTCVWDRNFDLGISHDLYGKHINANGSIGGPIWPPNQLPDPNRDPFLSVSNQTITYSLSIPGEVSIELYNVLGQQLSSESFFHQQAGAFSARLPTAGLSSGIYFLRLSTPIGEAVQKVAVVR
ncbi:T9SS type A sorting domain-containing protein [bacterium]|nr:T9SS type A sorting domain-containing protein [bacterium]